MKSFGEACKAEAVLRWGKFSARAMQYAVRLYKEKGGGYLGEKLKIISLTKWGKRILVFEIIKFSDVRRSGICYCFL